MRALFPIATALLAACSGNDSATPAAASASAKPVTPAGAGACIDEFVQVYEQASDQAAPASAENLCFDREDAQGPPKFPGTSRKITLEYKQGDYLATEESAHWTLGNFDAKRRCTLAVLSRSKVTARVRGGVKESTRLENGKLERSADTGDDYGSSIPLGAGPVSLVASLASVGSLTAPAATEESTPFGVECTRVAPKSAGVSMCSVTQPRKCPSTRVMLPIEIRAPAPTGGTQIGKTTALRVGGVVDSASWVLP